MRKRVFSGIRPTGELHLGNYLGAVRNWIALQDEYECIYGIVDYHAITTPFSPEELPRDTWNLVVDYLAAGVDPERSLLVIQSHLPEHLELAWIFGTITPVSWLERVPTYKEKVQEHPDYVNLGLLAYPVLMAADILIYKAEAVPVGEDQLPHIELTREIARRFNHMFGPTFPEPQAIVNQDTARVMSLTDPTKKMSKSHGPKSYIALSDPPEVIREKIMKAVTDVGPRPGEEMSPGVANLFRLLKIFAPRGVYEDFLARYRNGTLKYVELKEALAEAIIRELEPFRARRQELLARPHYVAEVVRAGVEKARSLARATLAEVREKTGLGLPVERVAGALAR